MSLFARFSLWLAVVPVLASGTWAIAGGYTFQKIDFQTLPRLTFDSQARGINNDGTIAGTFFDLAGIRHGFLTNDGVNFVLIDYTFTSINTSVYGINDVGKLVNELVVSLEAFGRSIRTQVDALVAGSDSGLTAFVT
jgi:probable HAF family extracellular repeat protein